MKTYIKNIYTTNNTYLTLECESKKSLKQMENYYCKVLKSKKPFVETVEDEGQSVVINPQQVAYIEIIEKKGE